MLGALLLQSRPSRMKRKLLTCYRSKLRSVEHQGVPITLSQLSVRPEIPEIPRLTANICDANTNDIHVAMQLTQRCSR